LEQFTNLTKKSIQQHISDLITDRLKNALQKEDEAIAIEKANQVQEPQAEEKSKVVTTEEELEGFMVIKSSARQKVAPTRITYRDAQSYFAVLLDDNNRKTICRLYLNSSKKYLVTLDEQKKEVKNEITEATFQYVDVDENGDLASKYGVRGVPTVVIEKDGVEVKRLVGMQQKVVLLNAIKSYL
jgi:hypothetical protein